jgi:hypothetical protein
MGKGQESDTLIGNTLTWQNVTLAEVQARKGTWLMG